MTNDLGEWWADYGGVGSSSRGQDGTVERVTSLKPIWAFAPAAGSEDIVLLVAPAEYDFVLERGYGILDGIRCTPVLGACHREPNNIGRCFLRMRLERPWQPRLRLAVAA